MAEMILLDEKKCCQLRIIFSGWSPPFGAQWSREWFSNSEWWPIDGGYHGSTRITWLACVHKSSRVPICDEKISYCNDPVTYRVSSDSIGMANIIRRSQASMFIINHYAKVDDPPDLIQNVSRWHAKKGTCPVLVRLFIPVGLSTAEHTPRSYTVPSAQTDIMGSHPLARQADPGTEYIFSASLTHGAYDWLCYVLRWEDSSIRGKRLNVVKKTHMGMQNN